MEDIELEIKILDYLQERLSAAERFELEKLLKTSPAFAQQFAEVKQAWEGLDLRKAPKVSADSKTNFQAMLRTFEMQQEHQSLISRILAIFRYKPKYNWAYAIALLCIGALGASIFFRPVSNNVIGDNATSEMQNKILMTLNSDKTIERIKAVSYVRDKKNVNDNIINALLTTLDNDPNENVRLVTLDALFKLADNAKVREGLVNSISHQHTELMQVALADAMLKLQEKRSVNPLKTLLKKQDADDDLVKKQLEQTVQKLESI